MLVGLAVIVLHVDGLQALADGIQVLPVAAAGQVGVTKIIADTHVRRIPEGVAQRHELIDAGAVHPPQAALILKVVFQRDADAALPGQLRMGRVIAQVRGL